jgi:hypothetical protein
MLRDFMENKKIVGMFDTKEEAIAQKLQMQAEGYHETYVLTGVGMFPKKYNVLQSTMPKDRQKPYENTPKLHIDIAMVLFALLGALDGGGAEDEEEEEDEDDDGWGDEAEGENEDGWDDGVGEGEGDKGAREMVGDNAAGKMGGDNAAGEMVGDDGSGIAEREQYSEGVLEQFLWNYTLMEQLAPNEPTYVSLKHTPKFHEMVNAAQEKGSMCSCGSGIGSLLRGLAQVLEKTGSQKQSLDT